MSLRGVWHETREQLNKCKKLLHGKEASYQNRVEAREAEWKASAEAQASAYEARLDEERAASARHVAEFQATLLAHQALESSTETRLQTLGRALDELESAKSVIEGRNRLLEREKEELSQLHSETLAGHAAMLGRMREEEGERLAALESEMKASRLSSQRLSHLFDHSLEDQQLQYVQQLAQAERALEEKSRALGIDSPASTVARCRCKDAARLAGCLSGARRARAAGVGCAVA